MSLDIKNSGKNLVIPYAAHLGVCVTENANGQAAISLEIKDEHKNSWDGAHGGVILSVLDMAMGLSARSLEPSSIGAVTIELKTNFLKVVSARLNVSALATRAGRNLIFVEASAVNELDEIAAKATGTFKLRYER